MHTLLEQNGRNNLARQVRASIGHRKRTGIHVAHERCASLVEFDFFEEFRERLGRRLHKRAVECARSREHRSLMARAFFPQSSSAIHSGNVTRNNNLTRCVVVGAHEHVALRSARTHFACLFGLAAKQRAHRTRARRRGFSHNLRAESSYAKRIALAYHATYRKGRDLSEREARHVCGANPAGFKRFGNGDGKRAYGRLGERGVAQRFRGSVQAHVGHIEPEGLARNGEGFRHLGRKLRRRPVYRPCSIRAAPMPGFCAPWPLKRNAIPMGYSFPSTTHAARPVRWALAQASCCRFMPPRTSASAKRSAMA